MGTPTTPTVSSTTTSTSISCPACYHEGSYYGIGETWQDKTKCKNYTCIKVANPCFPSNVSAQVTASTPVCMACPAGYKTQENREKCCPDCIPTDQIPDVCKVRNFGMENLEQEGADHGRCVSLKKY